MTAMATPGSRTAPRSAVVVPATVDVPGGACAAIAREAAIAVSSASPTTTAKEVRAAIPDVGTRSVIGLSCRVAEGTCRLGGTEGERSTRCARIAPAVCSHGVAQASSPARLVVPGAQPRPSRLSLAIVVSLPLVAVLVRHLAGSDYVLDDAYISFRYAQHVAAGQGWVWNPGGEPTQGFSSTVWVAVLSCASWMGLPLPPVALALSACALAGIAAAVAWLTWPVVRGESFWWLPAVAVSVAPLSVKNAMTGMETLVWGFLVVAVAALLAAWGDHPRPVRVATTAAFAIVACLTRFETVLFVPLWFGPLILAGLVRGEGRRWQRWRPSRRSWPRGPRGRTSRSGWSRRTPSSSRFTTPGHSPG